MGRGAPDPDAASMTPDLKSGFVHDAAGDKDDEWCMRRALARPGGNARLGGHIP